MVKRYFILLLLVNQTAFSQSIDKIINAKEVGRIEKTLSSDVMRGRKVFSPEIDKAAEFIAAEFKKAGLQPVTGNSYLQEFSMMRNTPVSAGGIMNGRALDEKNVAALTAKEELSITQASGYKQIIVHAKDTFNILLSRLQRTGGDYLLMVDTAQRTLFERVKRGRSLFSPKGNIVMVLASEEAGEYSIQYKQTVSGRP